MKTKTRYVLIRMSDGVDVHQEPIGMAAIPDAIYVNGNRVRRYVDFIHPYDSGVCVFDTTEAEYTSYQALGLFPEYKVLIQRIENQYEEITLYNPDDYEVKDGEVVAKS